MRSTPGIRRAEGLDLRDPEIHRRGPQEEPDVEPDVFARAARRFDLGFDRR